MVVGRMVHRIRSWALVPALVALWLVAPLRAQTVSGVLRDSLLTGGALPNATLWIEGIPRETKTDLYGRFKIDSVPAGMRTLAFSHPAFDAAGVAAPRFRIEVPAAGLQGIVLATPSAETRYARACPGPRAPGTGYVVGVVRDAATDSGVPKAVVNVMWAHITVDRTTGVTTARRTSRAETDARGLFAVCGVPIESELTVWATLGTASTGLVTMDLDGRSLAARQLTLGTRPVPAATKADSDAAMARLEGVVKTIDGAPIPDARVYVRGSRALTTTTTSGAFSLGGLPSGTQVVEVAAVGYQPGRQTVDLKPGAARRTEVVLGKSVQRLPTVDVAGKANDASGFEERARRGQGHYITEADIEKRGAISFEDIMRGVPGMMVEPVGQGYRVVSSRGVNSMTGGDCSPAYFLDGSYFPIDLTNGDPFPVSPIDIRGIEVYSGAATIPPEFQRQENTCGAVVIWTKRGGPARKK